MLLPRGRAVENTVSDSSFDAAAEPVGDERRRGTGSWLARALALSALLHALLWGGGAWLASSGGPRRAVETVDIELAPPPPKAETLPEERPPQQDPAVARATAAAAPLPADDDDSVAQLADAGVEPLPDAGIDAGIDAAVDAAPDAAVDARPRRKRPRPDAAVDARSDAGDAAPSDAAPSDAGDAAPGDASDRDGAPLGPVEVAGATDAGLDDARRDGAAIVGDLGDAAIDDARPGEAIVGAAFEAGLGDTPTSAGTASNLLTYVPPRHLVTALVRFDRLRGSRWAEPAERLLRPMPDYLSLFGDRDAKLAERFDSLVISSPRPRDPTATLLAGRSAMTRPQLRSFFAQQGTAIRWSTAVGGALGVRSGARVLPGDPRVILSPTRDWFFLADPGDLPGLTAPARGAVDRAVARAKLPPWLTRVQTIDTEAGEPWGPALIVTVTATRARWKVPDLGLGVTSVPAPERGTVALELVKQGWVVRGSVKFATEAEAEELVVAVTTVLQHIADSSVLQTVLRRANVLNAVRGLSVKRTGARVAYATSISIRDAEVFLALAAAALDDYFGQARRAPP
jgi:hypothetical protein